MTHVITTTADFYTEFLVSQIIEFNRHDPDAARGSEDCDEDETASDGE